MSEQLTPRELIVELWRRVQALEEKVAELEERTAPDPEWDTPLDLDGLLAGAAPTTADISPVLKTRAAEPEPLQVDEDAGVIDIVPPNRKQRKFRDAWLPRIALENLPAEWGLTKEEADAAYKEGGPVWLYLAGAGFAEEHKAGRDYILSLPADVRTAMVNDLILGEVSPRWVQEFGRDILKDETEGRRAAEVFAEATAGGYRMPGVN
jgi:hypothetical protein